MTRLTEFFQSITEILVGMVLLPIFLIYTIVLAIWEFTYWVFMKLMDMFFERNDKNGND